MGLLASIKNSRWFDNPLIRKCSALVSKDLFATYSRALSTEVRHHALGEQAHRLDQIAMTA